jgi:glycine/D-amino acid oxidase-like deaminating enzyme
MKKVDFLIIGQGIAGTVLAHSLEDEHIDFHIIQQQQAGESSFIAAGIINPITGKHFVKSWQIDLLLPFAKKKYEFWEKKLGGTFYFPRKIFRSIQDLREQNDWLAKTSDPSVNHYIADYQDITAYSWLNHASLGYGQTVGAGQVKWHDFLKKSADYWKEKGCFTHAMFRYEDLKWSEVGIEYGPFLADQIIFCEGYFMKNNPWFRYLPLDGAKGEALFVRMNGATLDAIVKHKYFLTPFSEGILWAGATNKWEFKDLVPDVADVLNIQNEVSGMLQIPHQFDTPLVGIRPTVRDRRPLIGRHPIFPRFLLFNGLGTKGTSLAPYWAHHFIEFLTYGKALSKEVNISRFRYQ